MRILFDHGTPRPLRAYLKPPEVVEAKHEGWDTLKNGVLLQAAESAKYDLLPTTDKNLSYQQNLSHRQIAVVVIGHAQWPVLQLHVARIVAAVDNVQPGSLAVIDIP